MKLLGGVSLWTCLIKRVNSGNATLHPIQNRDRAGVPQAGSPLGVVDATGYQHSSELLALVF